MRAKSKIVHNFTKNEYFLMKFSEVVKLMSSATSQSLSANGQVWTTFWTDFHFKFQLFRYISTDEIFRFPRKSQNIFVQSKISRWKKKIFVQIFFYIKFRYFTIDCAQKIAKIRRLYPYIEDISITSSVLLILK